jgi:dTMP kinase
LHFGYGTAYYFAASNNPHRTTHRVSPFAADRAQHFHEIVIPALKKGSVVISDRMGDSSLAYQGYGRGHDYTIIQIINQWTMHGIKPDLTIYLKIPVALAYERMRIRNTKPTIFEQEKQEFLERVARGFDHIFANRSDVLTLDATQTEKIVLSQALAFIKPWLQTQLQK